MRTVYFSSEGGEKLSQEWLSPEEELDVLREIANEAIKEGDIETLKEMNDLSAEILGIPPLEDRPSLYIVPSEDEDES